MRMTKILLISVAMFVAILPFTLAANYVDNITTPAQDKTQGGLNGYDVGGLFVVNKAVRFDSAIKNASIACTACNKVNLWLNNSGTWVFKGNATVVGSTANFSSQLINMSPNEQYYIGYLVRDTNTMPYAGGAPDNPFPYVGNAVNITRGVINNTATIGGGQLIKNQIWGFQNLTFIDIPASNESINFTITANDFYTSLAITNFSATTEFNYTAVCYQESANTSDQAGTDGNCNQNYNGSYYVYNTTAFQNPASRAYDGNWSNYASLLNAPANATIYVNYTKPSNSVVTEIIWSASGTALYTVANYTLPADCHLTNTIQLKTELNYTVSGTSRQTHGLCFNSSSSSWINVYSLLNNVNYAVLVEEGIYWNLSTLLTNTYTTTNGTIHTNFMNNESSVLNINLSSAENGGYFNKTYTNITVSSNLSATLAQSINVFTAYEKVSGNALPSATFATSYLTNTTHYMRAQEYNVTASNSGYYSRTINYTPNALSSNTQNLSYLATAILNLTVKNALTNAVITTFAAQLNYSNYSFSESQTTTNGSVYIYSIAGNQTITVNSTGFATTTTNNTLVPGLNNITVYVYTSESIWFNIYNEENESLLYQPNTTVELIGSYTSYNLSTSNNASIYVDLITPDSYIIRYYATGFTPRFGYITVTDRSTQNVTLYLAPAPSTTNITLTVREQDGSTIEDALIKVLKYDLDTNSYIVQNQILTDYNGKAIVDVYFNQEYYKFLVEYPVGLVGLETSPAYIISTDITLVVSSEVIGANYRYVADAAGSVTYNPATYNFRFTWSDSYNVVQEACLYVFRVENNYTASYVGNNCSTSSAGTMLIQIPNSTQAEYYAIGQFEIGDSFYEVATAWADLRAANSWGLLGLFVAMGLTVTITFIFIKVSPQAAILSVPFGITFTNVTGITQFAGWVPVAVLGVCLVIVFAMGRDK